MTETKSDKQDISELVHQSRDAEINSISEALLRNKNVLISGKFVTGKTTLAKEVLSLAEAGKIWPDQKVKTLYAWTERILDKDDIEMDSLEKISDSNPSVVVMDEVGHLTTLEGVINSNLTNQFKDVVREFNNKGILVIAVGYTNKELVSEIADLFPVIIDLETPPNTMAERDLINFRDANRLDEDLD